MPGWMEARDLGGGGGKGRGAAGIIRFLLTITKGANLHQFFKISSNVIHKANIEYILKLKLE